MMNVTYEIEAASSTSAVLYSLVPTTWGGVCRNYRAAGSVAELEVLKAKLEAKK